MKTSDVIEVCESDAISAFDKVTCALARIASGKHENGDILSLREARGIALIALKLCGASTRTADDYIKTGKVKGVK